MRVRIMSTASTLISLRHASSKAKTFAIISTGSHMEITAHNKRHSEMRPIRITEIQQLSPTVKGFKMELIESSAKCQLGSFLPGQWMDLYIPEIDQIGGYSMSSKSSKFEQHGVLDLAIKYSTWAPALWMHTKAQVNDELQFRFGGDYHYPNRKIQTNEPHRLVLIAGGVGINPLASIYFDVFDKDISKVDTHLLYSTKTNEELIFKKDLDSIANANSRFKVQYYSTMSGPRISAQDLLDTTDPTIPTYFFICGPSDMIKSINKTLLQQGNPKNRIFYELWT